MTRENDRVRIAVVAGSRRPNRRSRAVAEWVCAEHAVAGLELTLIDLDEVGLPPLAEPTPAAFGDYALEHTREWSTLVDRFDGYVLVTPEYNHSTTAALKDALDHLYAEWRDKAVAFVGYGTEGGLRAVEHLRGIVAELGMAGVGPSVALNIFDDFDQSGELAARDRQQQMRTRMLESLTRWAAALRPLRTAVESENVVAASGAGRPALDTSPDPAVAGALTDRLVERLQSGLDDGDADRYDSMFAADVLWGSPYGEVLTGYLLLNTAHRSMMSTPKVGYSRYEVVHTSMPATDVVLAHVRRRALSPAAADGPDFSEMALYVLIERDGQWWLAAGQNTPIRDKP